MNLIELHMLQSFPVSCLNRDDVGAPKSALFGGVNRARVSSQSWKRPIRMLAKERNGEAFGGQRTRYVVRELEGAFTRAGEEEGRGHLLAVAAADAIVKLDDPKKGNVKTLLFFSPEELQGVVGAMQDADFGDSLAEAYGEDVEKKVQEKALKSVEKLAKKAVKAFGGQVKDAADIAIFGRMVADDSSLTVEGAGLFSHALSTHAVANEIDFFSAVDDHHSDDAGAGHIGTLEFNSACYYRYVGLNLDLLADNCHLGHLANDERLAVVRAFLDAAIHAVPSARKNSMFGFNPPAFVLGLRRSGQPLSLVNAFERPVPGGQGYIEQSREALLAHWGELQKTYCLSDDVALEVEMPGTNVKELIEALSKEA